MRRNRLHINYISEEESNLRKLTDLSKYNEFQPVPIELDAEDENLESRISLVIEKANKTVADKVSNVRSYTYYTDDQKTLFLFTTCHQIFFLTAAKAAEVCWNCRERTAQTWAEQNPVETYMKSRLTKVIGPRFSFKSHKSYTFLSFLTITD